MLRLPIALLLSLVPVAALFAQTDPNSQPPGQIAGHVQNAITGDPVSGAQVQLLNFGPITPGANVPHMVNSQPDGSFVFDNVPAGLYSLLASAPNYSPGRYKGVGSHNTLDTFSVQSGSQVAGLVLTLQPYANLNGKVVDDAGQPVPHAQIQAFVSMLVRGKTELRPRTTATADETGQFEVKGVPNGKVYILASPAPQAQPSTPPPTTGASAEPKLDLVSTFYPNSLDLSGAVAMDVRSGQDQGDLAIHMKRAATYHIRGKVKVSASSGTKLAIEVSASGSSVSNASERAYAPGPDGQFDINGLIPGTYMLRLTSASSAGTRFSPSQHVFTRQDVTIAASDVNGIVLSQSPPAILTWRARSDDDENANLSGVIITLISWDDPPSNAFSSLSVNPDGSHAITVDPGSYLIHVAGIPPGAYVSSLQLNQSDALNKVVDLSQGGPGQVDIVFRKGLAELDGSITADQDGAPARPPTVILVPESLAPDGSNLMMRGTGRNSTFSFTNVAPGHYTAFAVEQFDYNAWQNPNFIAGLQGRGVSVDLSQSDRKHIELSVISASDLLQTMAQNGLGE